MIPTHFAAPVFEGAHWGHHGFAGYPVAEPFLAEEPFYNHYDNFAAAEVDHYLDNDFGYDYAPFAHGVHGHLAHAYGHGYPMDLAYLKGKPAH